MYYPRDILLSRESYKSKKKICFINLITPNVNITINILYHTFFNRNSKLGYLCEPQVKRMMLNVLKNSILIVLFVLVSSSGILAKGQNLSFKATCLEPEFCQHKIREASTIPLLLFLHESCELSLGYSHVVPASKSQLVPSFLQRNSKNNTAVTHSKRNLYFHPYSTLGKTKYYVFALREIIV